MASAVHLRLIGATRASRDPPRGAQVRAHQLRADINQSYRLGQIVMESALPLESRTRTYFDVRKSRQEAVEVMHRRVALALISSSLPAP